MYEEFILYYSYNFGVACHIIIITITIIILFVVGYFDTLPDGFKHIAEANTHIYLTKNVNNNIVTQKMRRNKISGEIFNYVESNAKLMKYSVSDICVILDDIIPIGVHVLSIIPTQIQGIMITTIITP